MITAKDLYDKTLLFATFYKEASPNDKPYYCGIIVRLCRSFRTLYLAGLFSMNDLKNYGNEMYNLEYYYEDLYNTNHLGSGYLYD